VLSPKTISESVLDLKAKKIVPTFFGPNFNK